MKGWPCLEGPTWSPSTPSAGTTLSRSCFRWSRANNKRGPRTRKLKPPKNQRWTAGVRGLYETSGKPPMVWILLPGPIKVLPELRST